MFKNIFGYLEGHPKKSLFFLMIFFVPFIYFFAKVVFLSKELFSKFFPESIVAVLSLLVFLVIGFYGVIVLRFAKLVLLGVTKVPPQLEKEYNSIKKALGRLL